MMSLVDKKEMRARLVTVVAIIGLMYGLFFWTRVIFSQETVTPTTPSVSPSNVDPETFREVAGDLRCPTCTGLSVLDSDAPFSVQIKNEVKEQLASGKSQKDILKFFTDRYGPWILRAPPVEGVNSLAWIIPIVALIFGPLFIWFFVGRGRHDAGRFQVRSTDDIVSEMKERLKSLGVEEETI